MDVLQVTLIGFGFLAGLKHAFDADHVAAVSTIIAEHRSIKKSSAIGMVWGLGHMVSLLVVGLLVLLLKRSIPTKLALVFELGVGVMLVILGVNVLRKMKKEKIHFHKHTHDTIKHIHFHSHALTKDHGHAHRSFAIGLLHGLAGSAGLALLLLATINSVVLGIIYILMFSLGLIIAMTLISGILSVPLKFVPERFERTQKMIKTGAAIMSMGIGLLMIYEMSFLIFFK